MLAADYVFGLAVAFIVGANLSYGPRIRRDRVAMQWGFGRKADLVRTEGSCPLGHVSARARGAVVDLGGSDLHA